jgi:hypothetical protein
MEDVLELYRLPYDPEYPVVCMDEASKQLIGEVRIPLGVEEGSLHDTTTSINVWASAISFCLSSPCEVGVRYSFAHVVR